MAPHEPSETSPLLPKDTLPPPPEPSGGVVPSSIAEPRDGIVHAEAGPPDGDEGSEEEREERQRQFEGVPELYKRMKYTFPALSIGVYLAAADLTIIVASYGKIGSDLDALNKTSWIATAYFLTMTSFQPLSGKLSDIFGRKTCLLTAYLIFGFGCLGCGLSKTIDQLIIMRAVAGVGGGAMTTVVSILMSDVIPLRERGTWQGYLNIVYAVGASSGAPLSGLFADGPGWRWSFLFQAPLCLVAFIAVAVVLKLPKSEEKVEWKEKIKRIDFLGALCIICGVSLLLVAFDRGSNVSWASKVCLIPLCISIPLFGVFVFVEVKIAPEPFAPGRIIFERSLFAAYLCNFFSFCGYMGVIFYLPLYFQAVNDLSATKAGLLLIPAAVGGVSGSLFAGLYMKRTGKYFWLTVLAYTNMTLGIIVILLFSGAAAHSTAGIVVGQVLCGFSNGIGVTTTLISLISNAQPADQAIVTSCSYLFRSLGSTTGVSLSSTVANQTLRALLNKRLSGEDDVDKIIEGVRRSLEYVRQLEPGLRRIVTECYEVATRSAFSLQVGLIACTALSAWFIREKPLSK